jgi:hypothetical protein
MNTTDPFRAKPIPHPRMLRASWIVLIGVLVLWMLGIALPHTNGINWRQWTHSTATGEQTCAISAMGMWYFSFDDSSGEHGIFAPRPKSSEWNEKTVRTEMLGDFRFLLFNYYRARFHGAGWEGQGFAIGIPYYAFIIPAMILPIRYRRRRVRRWIAWMKLRRLRRRRLALGHCACGYDLRAAQGRCPECGRAIRMIPTALPVRARRRRVARV